MDVEVLRAEPADWETVKQVRLRALADAPHAFGSTLVRECRFDDQQWQRRIGGGNWFLARSQGRAVGVVATVVEQDSPDEHHLVAMWVEPAQRGTATASNLVEAVCRRARAAGASAVTLWVANGNPRARRFYERLGFHPTNERKPLPSAPEVSEERMRRRLPPAHEE